MNIFILGATGGSGRAIVDELLAHGHRVTAASRHATTLADASALTRVDLDAMDIVAVRAAVAGHDAVVVTLGISENPLAVRLRGSRSTDDAVRSTGTRHVVAAMQHHGIRRLVVQSSYGVGPTRDRLPWVQRQFFRFVLAPQIADTERQEAVVRASNLDWVIAQPVTLTDDPGPGVAVASVAGDAVAMKVTRRRVARFLADAATSSHPPAGSTVALSGSAPDRASVTP